MNKCTILPFLLLSIAFSQWTRDPVANTLVESWEENQLNPKVAVSSDGSVWVEWGDRREYPDYEYRVAQFDFFGNRISDEGGYIISGAHSSSMAGNIYGFESDKDSGIYMLWEQVVDSETTGIHDALFLQQVNPDLDPADDHIVFQDGGVLVSDHDSDRKHGSLLVIDRDNVFVGFTSTGGIGYREGYVQKFTEGRKEFNSAVMVANSGTGANDVLNMMLVQGPDNSAFVIFVNNVSSTDTEALRVNHIASDGTITGGTGSPSGLGLGTLSNKNNWEMDAVYDGDKGVYIVWRNNSDVTVYQHVALDNNQLVASNAAEPIEITSNTASYVYPRAVGDGDFSSGTQGLIVLFYDYYDDTSYGLYSSYISGPTAAPSNLFQVTGTSRYDWPSGPSLAGSEFHEITNTLLEKEATVAWRGSSDGNLYVKKIFVNTDGNVDSTTPKVLVHDRSGGSGGEAWSYDTPGSYRLAHDGVGGAILTWEQDRNIDRAADIYIQQIGNDGMLGANNFTLVPNLHGNFRFIWNSHGEMTHWDLDEGTPLGPNGEWPAESGTHYLSYGGLLVMGYDGDDLLLGGIGGDEESWIPNSWGISSHVEEGFEFVSRYMIDQITGLSAKEIIVTKDGEDMVLIGTSLSHDGPDPLTFVRAGYALDWDVSYSEDVDSPAEDDLSGSVSFDLVDPINANTIPVKVSYMYDADGDDGSSPGYVGSATIFANEIGAGTHLSFDMDEEDIEDEVLFVERLQSETDSPNEIAPSNYGVIQVSGAVELDPGDEMNFITVLMATDSPDGFQSMLQSSLTYVVLAGMDEFTAAVHEPVLLPEEYALHQNYPNPFNPVTTIRYDLPQFSQVELTIIDLLGRKVKTLVNMKQQPGVKTVMWDGTDEAGRQVSAGIYLYQIKAGELENTKKMVLLK